MLGTERNYCVLLFSSANELAFRIGMVEVDKSDWLETLVPISAFLQANYVDKL